MDKRTALRVRRWLSTAVGVLTLGVAALVAAPAATAASISAIDTTSIVVTNTNGEDNVTQWSAVRIEAAWAVPDDAATGDTFTLQLPDELSSTETSFDLPATNDPSQTVVHCLLTSGGGGLLTCTLTDYVDAHTSVSGTLWFEATASSVTASTSVVFIVDGKTTVVDLPGGGGISTPPSTPTDPTTPPVSPLPTSAYKAGWQNGTSSLGWAIVIPGSALQGMDSATVSDTLASASGSTQSHHNTDGEIVVQSRTADSDTWADYTDWAGSWDASGSSFQLVLNGPFDADHAYQLLYITVPDEAYAGDIYANVAQVNGVKLTESQTWTVRGGGTGVGASLAQFAIKKVVDGDTTALPDDLAYTVKYSYGTGIKYELTVAADGTEVYSSRVSAGTTIILQEVDLPNAPGITWGTPVFSGAGVVDNGDGTATVTLASDHVVNVTLTNTANVTPPTPTPVPPTPAGTPIPTVSPAPVASTPTSSATPAASASIGSTASLAITGGELAIGVIYGSVVLLALGSLLMLFRRRPERD